MSTTTEMSSDEGFRTVSRKMNGRRSDEKTKTIVTTTNQLGRRQFREEKKKNIDPIALNVARRFFNDHIKTMPHLPIERGILLRLFDSWWARQNEEDVPAREEIQFGKVLYALVYKIGIVLVVDGDGLEWVNAGIWWVPRKTKEEPLFPHHNSPKHLKTIRHHRVIAKTDLYKVVEDNETTNYHDDDDEEEEEEEFVPEEDVENQSAAPPPTTPTWGTGDITRVRQPPPSNIPTINQKPRRQDHHSQEKSPHHQDQENPTRRSQGYSRNYQKEYYHHGDELTTRGGKYSHQQGGGKYSRDSSYHQVKKYSRDQGGYPHDSRPRRELDVDPKSEEWAQDFWDWANSGEHFFEIPESREKLENLFSDFLKTFEEEDIDEFPQFSKVLFALAYGNIRNGAGVLRVVDKGSRLVEISSY
jgi:hypothetical protein